MNYGENNVNAGPLKEFKEICVDRFIGDGLKSTVYFLSHLHTDHMEGLETEAFLKRLKEPHVRLYSHSLTLLLLAHSDFRLNYLGGRTAVEELIRSRKLVPLNADEPFQLNVPTTETGSYGVTVTLLPAGHCPGSVMFLFETSSKRILHTGDCRLTVNALKGIQHLHLQQASKKHVKRIDQLYIDTTFCTTAANAFPERQQAFDAATIDIREWINKGEVYSVKLQFPGRFAHEYVIMELYKVFNKKVHVNRERYEIYEQIPGLRECVSLNPSTPFHFCDNNGCLEGKPVKTLKLTSMWYTMAGEKSRSAIRISPHLIQVCYSMHSSLTEIAEMIDYLEPKIVTPLVKPPRSNMKEIHDALRNSCSWNFKFVDYQNKYEQPMDTSHHVKRRFSIELEIQHSENIKNEEDDITEVSSASKRFKASEDESNSNDWDFNFSQSPRKNSSCSSKESSQEIILEVCESMCCSQEDLSLVKKDVELPNNSSSLTQVKNLGSFLENSSCSSIRR